MENHIIKKKAIFFGNCHANSYITSLKNRSKYSNIFDSEYIVSYENLSNCELFYEKIKNCDLLVMNNITTYTEFSPDIIESKVPKNCCIIYIPFMRFSGFFDDERPLKKFKSNVLSSFPTKILEGISCQDFLYKKCDDLVVRNKVISKFNDAVAKLTDIDNKSTIKIKQHFLDNYKYVPTFMDYNHPTNYMLNYVYSELVKLIENHFNIDLGNTFVYNPKNHNPGLWFGHFSVIPDYIKDILDLQYNLDAYFIVPRLTYLCKIYDYETNDDNCIIDNFNVLSLLLKS